MYIVFQVCPTSLLIVAWTQFVQASKWVLKTLRHLMIPVKMDLYVGSWPNFGVIGLDGSLNISHCPMWPTTSCPFLILHKRNIFLVKLQARVIHFYVQMFQQIWMRHLSVWIPSCLWLLWITKFEASKGWMLKNHILYCTRTLFQQKIKVSQFSDAWRNKSFLVLFSSPIQSMRVFCVCCMNFQHRDPPPATGENCVPNDR